MIRFIYFDFGGVLVNYDNVFQKVCSDFNLDFDELVKFCSQFDSDLNIGKMKTEEFWEKCIEKYGLKNASDYNLPKWWVYDYKIIKPVNKLIYSLEDKIDMGIISNINSGVWEAAFGDKWVPNIKYKHVLLSCDLGIKKPDKTIYEIAQEKSGVSPEEILFIDDREVNLIIPNQMGWKTILFDQFKAEDGVKRILEKIII